MPTDRYTLREAVARLRKEFGAPKPPVATDPFEMVLWENCAYLVDDGHRARVFARLKKATRLDPVRIAGMSPAALVDLIGPDGGMQPAMRAEKVQEAANLIIDIGQKELRTLCKSDPKKARRLIKKFRGFSDPGADRVLMVAGGQPILGLESNGVRVLSRLGFGTMKQDWTRWYRSVTEAVLPELPATVPARIAAHQLLRQLGQTHCKHNAPRCRECPLLARCPHGQLETRRA
jgi:endonuclease III